MTDTKKATTTTKKATATKRATATKKTTAAAPRTTAPVEAVPRVTAAKQAGAGAASGARVVAEDGRVVFHFGTVKPVEHGSPEFKVNDHFSIDADTAAELLLELPNVMQAALGQRAALNDHAMTQRLSDGTTPDGSPPSLSSEVLADDQAKPVAPV